MDQNLDSHMYSRIGKTYDEKIKAKEAAREAIEKKKLSEDYPIQELLEDSKYNMNEPQINIEKIFGDCHDIQFKNALLVKEVLHKSTKNIEVFSYKS